MHSQIKIHNEHWENITKIYKYKKLNSKAEYNYILVNQAIIICKSNKEVTKEIEHISNNNTQRFNGRKAQDKKMNKQKIQLNYNKNHYTEQNEQYKSKANVIKDKNQIKDSKHNVGQLSTITQK